MADAKQCDACEKLYSTKPKSSTEYINTANIRSKYHLIYYINVSLVFSESKGINQRLFGRVPDLCQDCIKIGFKRLGKELGLEVIDKEETKNE